MLFSDGEQELNLRAAVEKEKREIRKVMLMKISIPLRLIFAYVSAIRHG